MRFDTVGGDTPAPIINDLSATKQTPQLSFLTFKLLINIKYKMRTKKAVPARKLLSRNAHYKSSIEPDDIFVTTKQKTYATIEETSQIHDRRSSIPNLQSASKREYLERMEVNDLSPFSSNGRSVSPPSTKELSHGVVKQKYSKKSKMKLNLSLLNKNKKNRATQSKSARSSKNSERKIEKKIIQYEKQFLKRMNRIEDGKHKKITQLSEEDVQTSTRKRTKKTQKSHSAIKIQRSNSMKTNLIRSMHLSIKQKYYREFPQLQKKELKVLSAVVLVQRLWRQRKVKEMIDKFLLPKAEIHATPLMKPITKIEEGRSIGLSSELSYSNTIGDFLGQKKLTSNPLDQQSEKYQLISRSELNLKDLQLSDELPVTKKERIAYVAKYRDVVLQNKKHKQKNKHKKPNAFDFPESLSEKCLLQKLYKKTFSKPESTEQNSPVFFPIKNGQKSKELIISQKNPQIVQLQEEFYSQAKQQNFTTIKQSQKEIRPEAQTVGTIDQIAAHVISFMVAQFSEEFKGFSDKKCLKKKKRLPGIIISSSSINRYIQQYSKFLMESHCKTITESFSKLTFMSFLKVYRIIPEESPFDQETEQEEDLKIIPNQAYFVYQSIYEQKLFPIRQQDKKYSNFLSGLIKIHNKCLSDALSELLEKERIDRIVYPWDTLKPIPCPLIQENSATQTILQEAKQKITKFSETKLGKLHGKDPEAEEIKLLNSLKIDYQDEGKDWCELDDKLQIRLQISELIIESLYEQFLQENTHLHQ